MTIATEKDAAAYGTPAAIVDRLMVAEKGERLGIFVRQPFSYLREIGVSDDNIVHALYFYGPDTVIMAADGTLVLQIAKKTDSPAQAFGYMLEALELNKRARGRIPITGEDVITETVDRLYSDLFGVYSEANK